MTLGSTLYVEPMHLFIVKKTSNGRNLHIMNLKFQNDAIDPSEYFIDNILTKLSDDFIFEIVDYYKFNNSYTIIIESYGHSIENIPFEKELINEFKSNGMDFTCQTYSSLNFAYDFRF